jgi:HEAT repeat protein
VFLILFQCFGCSVFAQRVKDEVDSLFIKASSGMVMFREEEGPAKEKLIQMGVEAVPYLVEKMDSQDAREILTLVDILSEIGDPAVLPLIESLKSEDEYRLRATARTLGKIKDRRAVLPLAQLLSHPTHSVRGGACSALGKIGDTTITEEIIVMLYDSVETVRKSASVALGELKDQRGISPLISALKDPHYSVRMTACISLSDLGDVVVDTLLSLLEDKNDFVRNLSIVALGKMKKQKAVEPLMNELNHPDWSTRAFAVCALGEIEDPVGMVAVVNLKKKETHPFVLNRIEYVLDRLKDK